MTTTFVEFSDHELIETNKIFWRIDQPNRNGDGWPHKVYFDRTSNVFRVLDFPSKEKSMAFADLPVDGHYEFESDEPIQYARDYIVTRVEYIVR